MKKIVNNISSTERTLVISTLVGAGVGVAIGSLAVGLALGVVVGIAIASKKPAQPR